MIIGSLKGSTVPGRFDSRRVDNVDGARYRYLSANIIRAKVMKTTT
jgi:hypothetical protein